MYAWYPSCLLVGRAFCLIRTFFVAQQFEQNRACATLWIRQSDIGSISTMAGLVINRRILANVRAFLGPDETKNQKRNDSEAAKEAFREAPMARPARYVKKQTPLPPPKKKKHYQQRHEHDIDTGQARN